MQFHHLGVKIGDIVALQCHILPESETQAVVTGFRNEKLFFRDAWGDHGVIEAQVFGFKILFHAEEAIPQATDGRFHKGQKVFMNSVWNVAGPVVAAWKGTVFILHPNGELADAPLENCEALPPPP